MGMLTGPATPVVHASQHRSAPAPALLPPAKRSKLGGRGEGGDFGLVATGASIPDADVCSNSPHADRSKSRPALVRWVTTLDCHEVRL